MNFIYMIITSLVTTALAKGAMECNLTQVNGAQQCLGALGKPFIFYLPTGRNEQTILTKNTTIILKVVNSKGVYCDHSTSFTNGILKFETLTKKDSGDYLLETHGLTDGILLNKIYIHLEIQAPVSKPAVSQMCLSPEQMKVSCSTEGDGVEFILTLDGNLLIQTRAGSTDEHKPSVSHVTISLHGQLTGILTSNVRNNVSREETFIHLTSCKGSTSQPFVVTVAVMSTVAILLLPLACFYGIKHLTKRLRPRTGNNDNTVDEIIYSDVRVMKPTRETRFNPCQNASKFSPKIFMTKH